MAERAGVARSRVIEQDDDHIGAVSKHKRSGAMAARFNRRADGRPELTRGPVVSQRHAEHEEGEQLKRLGQGLEHARSAVLAHMFSLRVHCAPKCAWYKLSGETETVIPFSLSLRAISCPLNPEKCPLLLMRGETSGETDPTLCQAPHGATGAREAHKVAPPLAALVRIQVSALHTGFPAGDAVLCNVCLVPHPVLRRSTTASRSYMVMM